MRSHLLAVALVATLAPAARAQTTSANVDLENWMANLPGIADLPLTKLPIPGTHDSGSYSITRHSPWALTAKQATPALMKLPGFLVKPTAAGWARTQPKAVFWQFAEGIRFVDLRLSHEPDGNIYIEHTLRGANIDEVLDDIAKFAFAHPKELLFVDAARFTNFSAASHDLFLKKVRASFGTRLVPSSVGTSATLRQLWTLDRNVIVLYDDPAIPADPANGDIWDEAVIFQPWPNVQNTTDLLAANKKYLAQRDPTKIWGLSGTVTPDDKMIVKGVFELGPESIEDLMKKVHPDVQSWLRHDFRASVNLVTTDWYDAPWDGGTSFVREVLSSVDGIEPPVPFGLKETGSGVYWKWFSFHTWVEYEWEPVPGATEYEVRLRPTVFLLPGTTSTTTTSSARVDRKDLPWGHSLVKWHPYMVSVRAMVGGVWQDWSLAKRIRL